MSNQNRQPRQPRQVKIFSIEALSAARMDVIAEHRRVHAETQLAVEALRNEYDAIFRGVNHR